MCSSIDAKVTILDFNSNEIVKLCHRCFQNVTGVKVVDLHSNKIYIIERTTFYNMIHLRFLN